MSRQENTLIDEFNIDVCKFLAVYAGNIGEAQCVETLLRAAEILRKREDILFIIIGTGVKEAECRKFTLKHGLKNVLFIPMQPPERISEVYSLGDISFVTCKKGFGDCGMPSKSSNIMASKCAVLASFDVDSELGNIIRSNNAGVIVPPEDPSALASAIESLANNKKKCAEYGSNGYTYFKENLTSEICTDKILSIINSLLSKRR